MKFLIAAIIGALLTWFWLTTAGKKHITKTITITETNWVTQIETQYVDVARWVTQTNIVWVTNLADKSVAQESQTNQASFGVIYTPQSAQPPATKKSVSQPVEQPQSQSAERTKFQGSKLQGPRPTGKVIIKKDNKPTIIKTTR